MFDEVGQRGLPGLLAVIGERAELLWVEPELACHLHVRVREPVTLAGLRPRFQSGGVLVPAHIVVSTSVGGEAELRWGLRSFSASMRNASSRF